MKKTLGKILCGKENKFNGFIAIGIVSLIVLGCTCNKNFGNLGSKDTNTSDPTNVFSPPSTNTGTAPTKDTNFTKADASKKQIPSDAEMQDIVKTTLLDFNDALQTEDFTTFRSNISPLWAKQKTAEQLKQTFQSFIDGEANLSPISSMDATFTTQPHIIKNLGMDMLEVKGEYPTSPIKTTFELQYAPTGKEWRLTSIQVYTAIKRKP